MQATGGNVTRYRENGTNFIAHIFTNSAAADTFTPTGSLDVDYLLVAGGGGGGGGYQGGGGGGGGVRLGRTNMTASTVYTITVGAGGYGARWDASGSEGSNGLPSSMVGPGVSINTTGGGRGSSESPTCAAAVGGSGGGGGPGAAGATAVGGGELGNSGGNSTDPTGRPCGGGGGAGGAGGAATVANTPGVGGAGTNLTFSGLPVTYATGGKGGYRAGTRYIGASGATNTGNGGEGAGGPGATEATWGKGGNGGSGIVIVRYVDSGTFTASVTATSATAQWPVQIGAFTITRPDDANTNYSMTVAYTMSGTATNGTDYSANSVTNGSTGYPSPTPTPLSGSVTFGVGVTSVVVNLYPLYNPPFSAKTATLTLNVDGTPTADVTFPAWSAAGGVVASGGVLTNYFENGTNFNARIFTNSAASDTLTLTSGGTVEYLVIAGGGGGGGGWEGGGGGAGGVRLGRVPLPAGSYTITVGAGGKGVIGGVSAGSNGLPSVISAVGGVGVIATTGGGRGYAEGVGSQPTDYASAGGSGGGAYAGSPGAAVGGGELGNSGGGHSLGNGYEAGGGGGAGGPGGNSTGNGAPGVGGAGTNLTFSGASVTYATGGKGGWRTTAYTGANGTANRGNGGEGAGGGTGANGGNGGSGIVIVRYDTGVAKIQNLPASNTATNGATLNGWLVSDGLSATAVSVRYGTNNGAVSGAWAFTNGWNTGDWSDNSYPATNITGLMQDRTYYYTFAASNAAGEVVAVLPANFMSFITGEVRVDTTGDNAQFAGGNGQFTISRPATCASEPLTVYYSMSGSASNGLDYVGTNELALPGSVVINAGATSATVRFRVKADSDTTNEQAVLTLLSGYAYPVSAAGNATVTILPGTPGGGLVTTGGTLTRYRENGTNFIARIFTNSAVLAVSSNGANTAMDYLVVAGGGGGGGGYQGGGGGAGGVRIGSTNLEAGEYTVTVGAGGYGARWDASGSEGSNGLPSSIVGLGVSINTTGGGRGASEAPTYAAAAGGSGGGGGHGGSAGGGAPVGGGELGNSGGADGGGTSFCAGGGGGALSAGSPGPGGAAQVGGAGGSGTNLTFSGSPVTYATGGKGGYRAATRYIGASGAANTGSGGEGAGGAGPTEATWGKGGAGGSGIVMVRYVDTSDFNASVAATSATAQWPVQMGAFTITRPADANTNYSASVSYTLSGTAVNGVDYSANAVGNGAIGYPSPAPQALSGYATFDVGVTSVVVNLYPLYNPPFSAKTAIMTLNVVGSPAATVNFQVANVGRWAQCGGGTMTRYTEGGTNWTACIFTNSAAPDTLTITGGGPVEYLVVAGGGGGGGGWNGGGGGAGGVRIGSVTLPAGTYTVTVGAGGPGANRLGSGINGSNGMPSVISAAVGVIGTTGGGRGNSEAPDNGAGSGGSGGGTGGSAVGGGELGNNGGGGSQTWTGGGGGARTVGGTGATGSQGLGGGGTNLAFSGVSVTYAAGGNGCAGRVGRDGANALANTGNGGSGGDGGTPYKGGNGGSGIVIVRFVRSQGTLLLVW